MSALEKLKELVGIDVARSTPPRQTKKKNYSGEVSIKELDDEEDRLYLICVDIPGIKGDELGEQISRAWERAMDESELVLLDGKYGDGDDADYTVEHTTLSETFDFYCSSCGNEKLFNQDKKAFYCPVCDS